MAERVETVVVGAGQAGLATSYFLSAHGRDHVVLERGRVGETWRSERWDGFFLNTPRWTQQLPGFEYAGDDPDGFAPLAEVIEYVEGYARSFGAPIREGVVVKALRPRDGGYVVETSAGELEADNAVVATGAFQRPTPPAPGAESATVILQLHTSAYRRPDQLPDGAVLVVGSGQSGCQIADELLDADREVHLSVGRCPWLPRRYRGRDILHWLLVTGVLDETVNELPSPGARLGCNPPVSGNDRGHDCHPRWLERRGASLVGRVARIDGSRVSFEPGLGENLAFGNAFVADLERMIDEHVAHEGLDAPAPEELPEAPPPPVEAAELDLAAAGVTSILWASGFRPDYSWIELPLVDGDGWAVQERGVTRHPGLYVVGLNWLHKRKSALFCGVGEDAAHVVAHLSGRK
ncbi:MAG: flavin-containing monooxygenase [Gaiellaceae bacterium]